MYNTCNNTNVCKEEIKYKKAGLVKFSYFKSGYRNGWETNWRIGKLSLRIAKRQFAFWVDYNPIFNLLF